MTRTHRLRFVAGPPAPARTAPAARVFPIGAQRPALHHGAWSFGSPDRAPDVQGSGDRDDWEAFVVGGAARVPRTG